MTPSRTLLALVLLPVLAGCGSDAPSCDRNAPCAAPGMVCDLAAQKCVPGVGYADIETDFVQLTCTRDDCHGTPGGMTSFVIDPAAGKRMDNYRVLIGGRNSSGPFVDSAMPLRSQLLVETQSMGHRGGQFFRSNADPTYVKWLSWIKKGAPF